MTAATEVMDPLLTKPQTTTTPLLGAVISIPTLTDLRKLQTKNRNLVGTNRAKLSIWKTAISRCLLVLTTNKTSSAPTPDTSKASPQTNSTQSKIRTLYPRQTPVIKSERTADKVLHNDNRLKAIPQALNRTLKSCFFLQVHRNKTRATRKKVTTTSTKLK